MDRLTEFVGPFPLDTDTIRSVVTRTESPGNYVLGAASDEPFRIAYVGRSDTSLCRDLVELEHKTGCRSFQFRYAASSKEAFEVECALFHNLRQSITNTIHPQPPSGSSLRCPLCKVLF